MGAGKCVFWYTNFLTIIAPNKLEENKMRNVRTENVRRCACGKAYEFFSMMVGDQSVCPECREKLTQEIEEGRKIHTDDAD